MTINPQLENIDFNKEEHLKKILFRDKHTRIEGLFTEHFFYEEILRKKFEEISTGWWFGLKNNQYTITRFTTSVHTLTKIDFEILNFFSSWNRSTYIVEFSEIDKSFCYSRYVRDNGHSFRNHWDRIKRPYPSNPNFAPLPSEKDRNAYRLNQATMYLKEKGVLKKSAIERIFANMWLGNAYFWDIDFFVKHRSKLVAFEVKQKFPTAKGTWGLNTGLKNLFSYLNSIGIIVVHVILVKPVNDASIPAIDLYTKDEYRKDAKWVATKFDEKAVEKAFQKAPRYTSIHSSYELSYFHLKSDSFTQIKEVASERNDIIEFLNQITE